MKQLLFFIFSTACVFNLAAQQSGFNYKAIIKDDLGNVVANQNITVQFRILENTTQIYQETHVPTTDANGIIILSIGSGNTTDNFSSINWSTQNHNLNLQVDIGNGFIDLGTIPFQSVPYASNVTGLETIDEGNGIGYRLAGKNPLFYGNIGLQAIDLSIAPEVENENFGAIGNLSLAIGNSTSASGSGSVAIGNGVFAKSLYATAIGVLNADFEGSPGSWVPTDPLFQIGNGEGQIQSNALNVLKNGTILAPSFDLSLITDDKALITKEYADANLTSSGLESIDEGNGIGYRLVGRNPLNYGDIGLEAVDLSFTQTENNTAGATGNLSVAIGNSVTSSGPGSVAIGNGVFAKSLYATAIGVLNADFEGSPGSWVPTDPLFQIGNGEGQIQSNALNVLKNGTITAPSFDLNEITDDKALITKEYADTNLVQDLSLSGDELQISSGGNSASLRAFINPKFPDGFKGASPVIFNLSSPYTVPAGKTLYITQAYIISDGISLKLNNITVKIGPENNSGKQGLTNPIIAGSGDAFSCISGDCSQVTLNGFLTDTGIITPITSSATNYSVPTGKMLVLFSICDSTSAPVQIATTEGTIYSGRGSATFLTNETSWAFQNPMFFDSGENLTFTPGGGAVGWNGYLIDK